jgi:hypothetical protein
MGSFQYCLFSYHRDLTINLALHGRTLNIVFLVAGDFIDRPAYLTVVAPDLPGFKTFSRVSTAVRKSRNR